jgi:hypothetical protein
MPADTCSAELEKESRPEAALSFWIYSQRIGSHQPNDHQVVAFHPVRRGFQGLRLPLFLLVAAHEDGVPLAVSLRRLLLQGLEPLKRVAVD